MVVPDRGTRHRRLVGTVWAVNCWTRYVAICASVTHIIPVGASHLQSSVPLLWSIEDVTITCDILKGVASSPVVWASSSVSLQLVRLGEIVPRS